MNSNFLFRECQKLRILLVMSLFFKISYLAAGGIPYVAVVQPTSTVYSDSLIFGYSDNKMALNLGLDIEVGIQGGIQLTEEFSKRLKGNKITEIWFAVGKVPTKQHNYVFISKKLGLVDFDYKQAVERVDSGLNKIILDKPFEISGEELFVGYRLVSSGDIFSMDGREDNELANFIRLTQDENDSTCAWQHQSGGNINIQVVVQGDHLPQNDLAVEGCLTKSYAKTGEPTPIKIWVRNTGAAEIKSIEANAYIDNSLCGEFIADNIDIKRNQIALVNLGDILVDVNGLHDLKVTVSKVNGMDDENESDNSILKKNIVCKKEYSNRKVLLEHFSTMKCVNCPTAHSTIDDALFYREDVIHVIHHSAYGTDPLTIDASNDYTFFYSNGSQTSVYAPGCMLDRTNMSKYGATDGSESTLGPVFFPQRTNFGHLLDESLSRPAYVTVDVKPTYDPTNRKLMVGVSGQVPDEDVNRYVKGDDTRLNIFLIEDSIIGYQAGANNPQRYFHNAAIRQVLTSIWGDSVVFDIGKYKSREYECILPETWNPMQMHVVAFLSNYNPLNPNDCEVLNANAEDIRNVIASGVYDASLKTDASRTVRIEKYCLVLDYEPSSYRIYNLNGELVLEGANCGRRIDLNSLQKGVYVCKIFSSFGIQVVKISI